MERGANISTIDNHGNTAVHITAKQGFFNIMSLLLKRRANFDCSNNVSNYWYEVSLVASWLVHSCGWLYKFVFYIYLGPYVVNK